MLDKVCSSLIFLGNEGEVVALRVPKVVRSLRNTIKVAVEGGTVGGSRLIGYLIGAVE